MVREKAVYHTLNLHRADLPGMLRGEGWVTTDQFEVVKEVVASCHARCVQILVRYYFKCLTEFN